LVGGENRAIHLFPLRSFNESLVSRLVSMSYAEAVEFWQQVGQCP
jgi:hypothetical protein